MGFPEQDHIKRFVKGKTIDRLEVMEGIMLFHFTDGEILKLVPIGKIPTVHPEVEVIVTPLKADGTVKQSVEIMAEADCKISRTMVLLCECGAVGQRRNLRQRCRGVFCDLCWNVFMVGKELVKPDEEGEP